MRWLSQAYRVPRWIRGFARGTWFKHQPSSLIWTETAGVGGVRAVGRRRSNDGLRDGDKMFVRPCRQGAHSETIHRCSQDISEACHRGDHSEAWSSSAHSETWSLSTHSEARSSSTNSEACLSSAHYRSLHKIKLSSATTFLKYSTSYRLVSTFMSPCRQGFHSEYLPSSAHYR